MPIILPGILKSRPIFYEANENITSVVLKGLSVPMNDLFKLKN